MKRQGLPGAVKTFLFLKGTGRPALKLRVLAGLFLLGAPLFPSTLSVMVVETGLAETAPVLDASSLWEGSLMDELFELGHIVTNAPILRLAGPERYPDERLLGLDEALAGGVEYYILAVLEYEISVQDDPAACRPRSIALRFVRLAPRRVLYEVRYAGNPRATLDETRRQAAGAVRALLSHFAD
jgi:hypothetical protein